MTDSSFTVSHHLKVAAPREDRAYVVSTAEWQHIKENVSKIKGISSFYQNLGSVLLGASLSAFLTAFSVDLCPAVEGDCVKDIIVWSFAVSSLVCGLLSLHFGHAQKELRGGSLEAVVAQMDSVERRYDSRAES